MNDQLFEIISERISRLPGEQDRFTPLIFNRDQSDDYQKIILDLGKFWEDKYSKKFIKRFLDELIRDFSSSGNEKIKMELRKQNDLYNEYEVAQTIYIPIDGINFSSSQSLEVGKVTLIQVTEERFEHILSSMLDRISETKYSDEEKSQIIKIQKDYMKEHLLNRVCAKMTVVAEPEKAYELTVLETSKAFELLRYAIPCFKSIFDMENRVEIGLLGDVPLGTRFSITLSSSGFRNSLRTPQENLNLSNENLREKLNQIGFTELSQIIKKDNKTEFEKNILRFLHWISDSHVQIELENKLLSLIISLETLFGSGAHATGFGAAMLLGENLEQRREIKSRIADLYKHRNNVAHGSRRNNVEDKDVSDLIILTMELMTKMLELIKGGAVSSKKELQGIIETKQLS